MKKTTALLLMLITVFMYISSCSTKNNETPEETKPIKDVFLSSSGVESEQSDSSGFISASVYAICGTTVSEDKVFDQLKGKKKTLFDSTKTFVYQRSECEYKTLNGQKEYGDFYSVYDIYIEEEDGDRIEYLHDTNIVTCYFKGNIRRPSTGLSIDEKYAKQKAEDFILKVITEEEFSKFDEGVLSEYGASGLYACKYTRYIEEYATDEDVTVVMTPDGEVVIYSARYFGKYDALEVKLTKEKLDTANEKLRTKIEEMNLKNLSMGISRIVTTIFGEAFLRIPIDYETNNGEKTSEYVYINIQ